MTADVTHERIRKVLAGVLAPLARTLLRCGVSYTEFAELAKRAFVDAASKDYGVRNRPTNIARVAVMTGLSRKEVSRIRGGRRRQAVSPPPHGTLPGAVLNAWHTNPRFVDKSGGPKILRFAGVKDSFSALVRSVNGDIPPGAIRRELIRAGAARSLKNGKSLIALKRYFVPSSADDRVVIGMELGLTRMVETIAFNSEPAHSESPRFQRFVEGPIGRVSELGATRNKLQQMLEGFSSSVDDYLSSIEKKADAKSEKGRGSIQVGVGLYYFDNGAD